MEELDRRILAFVGAHRFVLSPQIRAFLDSDEPAVRERLANLEGQLLVRGELLGAGLETFWRVTAEGLAGIGSRMPPPGFDLAGYRHVVGVAWLWVIAWKGRIGPVDRVLGEREMRSLDRAARETGAADGRFAVPLPDRSPFAAGGLYPDVMLVSDHGTRVAIHLFTWPYLSLNLAALFSGHAARTEVADFVLVFVDDRRVGHQVRKTADGHGVGDRVRVQGVTGQGTRTRNQGRSAGELADPAG